MRFVTSACVHVNRTYALLFAASIRHARCISVPCTQTYVSPLLFERRLLLVLIGLSYSFITVSGRSLFRIKKNTCLSYILLRMSVASLPPFALPCSDCGLSGWPAHQLLQPVSLLLPRDVVLDESYHSTSPTRESRRFH